MPPPAPGDEIVLHSLHPPQRTGRFRYVVAEPAIRQAAIIDPALDYDERSGTVSTDNAAALIAHVARERLTVAWILDTRPHADYLSAAMSIRSTPRCTGCSLFIGHDDRKDGRAPAGMSAVGAHAHATSIFRATWMKPRTCTCGAPGRPLCPCRRRSCPRCR